jgi:hypothetical protein
MARRRDLFPENKTEETMSLLYHSFPRYLVPRNSVQHTAQTGQTVQRLGALGVLDSILDRGLLLTFENIAMPWDDPYGHLKANQLDVIQYRFCLTSLRDDEDILHHSSQFGPISLGFSTQFIRRLGGFPVFYLPSPVPGVGIAAKNMDDVGVSLIYRIAEVRAILEAVELLPATVKRTLTSNIADLQNTIGAVRFLGNILYLTDYLRPRDAEELRYYKQREWRIIAGLCPSEVTTVKCDHRGKDAYAITSIMGSPVARFIEDVVVVGTREDQGLVEASMLRAGMKATVRLIERQKAA